MFNHTISAILRGDWLINEQFANEHLPLVLGMLTGKTNGADFLTGNGEMEKPFVVSPSGKRTAAFIWNWKENSYQLNEAAFESGSVGVIPMIGPVMKYTGSCGEPGMIQRQSWTSDIVASDKIAGIISYIDSPGGQADGTPQAADYIKSIEKPKIALVNGGAYSGGAWYASAHDKIYAVHEYSGFGSIGAYTNFINNQGYFEQQGFKIEAIYPDESKDKNLSHRMALKGDFSLKKAEVAELANYFRSAFAENRSGKLNSEEWNTGKDFNSQDSIRIGLIDGIKSMDAAMQEIRGQKVFALGAASSNTSTENVTHNNSDMSKFTAIAALAGNAAPSQDQLDLANSDLTVAGITGVTLVAESFISDAANVTSENTRLTSELATATSSLATANASLATAQSRVTELEAQLASMPGAQHNTGEGNSTDTPPDGETKTPEQVIAALPHNREAAEYLGI